jgi:hypothetical protein
LHEISSIIHFHADEESAGRQAALPVALRLALHPGLHLIEWMDRERAGFPGSTNSPGCF